MEFEDFVFRPRDIQGFYHLASAGTETEPEPDGEPTETISLNAGPTTVLHLESWVSPIGRPDPDKIFYHYLRFLTKPATPKL